MSTLDTRNMTRRPAPRFPYEKALEAVLPAWDISLVFAGATCAKTLNWNLRWKTYVPNVLSYETGKKSGEIIICLEEAKKQSPTYGMPYPEFVGFLFIHALMHLKGYPHGPTMEKKERALLARIISSSPKALHAPTNSNRNRHRNAPDESRGR